VTVCAGFFLDAQWVMTAAHCLEATGQRAAVVTWHGPDGGAEIGAVQAAIAHPGLDVALLALDAPTPSVSPLALATRPTPDYLATAGRSRVFGPRNGSPAARRWTTPSIVGAVGAETFSAEPRGGLGACVGDSGSPLLVTDRGLGTRVLGILSEGSIGCTESDVYVRADRALGWARSVIASRVVPDAVWAGVAGAARCRLGAMSRSDSFDPDSDLCSARGRALCETGVLLTEASSGCNRQGVSANGSPVPCAISLSEAL
jgi:hypothetical protein